MFYILIGFDNEVEGVEVATFKQMERIKDYFEGMGHDVEWEYEP